MLSGGPISEEVTSRTVGDATILVELLPQAQLIRFLLIRFKAFKQILTCKPHSKLIGT
jgi:hypothetical protein